MRTADNPYSPGAGNPPPELAGREGILRRASSILERTLNKRMTKSMMMLGLRGVGKTVLLNRIQQMADDAGCVTGFMEAEGRQALPNLLAPHLRGAGSAGAEWDYQKGPRIQLESWACGIHGSEVR